MVTDEHRAFAQAVVALAREHNMDGLDMTFRGNVRSPVVCWQQIRMTWSDGRHGVPNKIQLTTEARDQIEERAPEIVV